MADRVVVLPLPAQRGDLARTQTLRKRESALTSWHSTCPHQMAFIANQNALGAQGWERIESFSHFYPGNWFVFDYRPVS